MKNGIEIDRFLYEIMVIWSAVHELEIDMLLQIYETIVDGRDQKNYRTMYFALLHELLVRTNMLTRIFKPYKYE